MVELEFFVEEGKPENPEKNKPAEQRENQQQTQPTHGTGPESNPGHISGSSISIELNLV